MKKLFCLLSAFGLVALSGMSLAAEENGFYVGAALGSLDLDFSDGSFRDSTGAPVPASTVNLDFDRAALIRLSGGYNWRGWAFEFAYESSLKETDFTVGANNTRSSYDYGNFSVAGVYRSAGQLYLLGKFGVSQPDIDTELTGARLQMGSTGFAGAGLGYRFNDSLAVEFDFTRSNDDTSNFMLGLRHHF